MVSKARRNSSLPRELSLVLSRHSHAKRCQKLCVGKPKTVCGEGGKEHARPFLREKHRFSLRSQESLISCPLNKDDRAICPRSDARRGGEVKDLSRFHREDRDTTHVASSPRKRRRGGATAVRGGPIDKTGKSKTPPSEALAESPLLLPCVRSRYQPRGSPRTRQLSGPYYVCKKARSLTKSFFDGRTW